MAKHVVLGATGHVGSACAHALLDRGETVVAIVRHDAKPSHLRERGAEVRVVDIGDSDALRDALQGGDRAFLLNPPAAPSTDTDAEERRTVVAMLAALADSGLDKIVAASTYGAQPGAAIGDLSVLYGLEQGLQQQAIPVAINRAAYYFSNWDASLQTARDGGVVRTPFPAQFVLPMVAPADLGQAAARRLLSDTQDVGIRFVEGPARHTPQDVADLFAELLRKAVRVETVPREGIEQMFRAQAFSAAAARAYTRMTEKTLDRPCLPDDPERGAVTLRDYLADLVERSA